ncbi:peptide chain release factor N(5)-glutamine methyltransferase [Erwiniaceae bacterium BAC15a-03b]|uniref:Release factor glutamine methyltransferase n=1 Tax=Winslowiella arboricola TaxID=2978220 RepID=A0A9J6PTH5_9GAMM|nr:peptide chain release factor N(5)-glutamine methyltransferase [Winslowiella arboricola]MCU5774858.1 peptide chain release factor N(5)-glutamine methyltransferase [Winslowiella arboricola]MCU5779990.1 peptide chain release factor N(5)-glutamine methyltransferase [Winslowiella arboricola]
MDIRSWLKAATAALCGGDSPKRDAEILLGFVTGKSRSWLIAFDETELTAPQLAQLEALIARRANGEPVAHLTGEREFWSLPLSVSAATLIPRPDTEILVEQALARLPASPAQILDLGTGTGAVALALASERADCQVVGVDRIAEAVTLAQHNAAKLQLTNARFLLSDWFSALENQRFDLIVSNPPYIDADDQHLQQGDVRFEPLSALVADEQGLADIRRISAAAARFLQPGGWLLFEHGWQQAAAVRDILRDHNFLQVETCQDYAGNDRVTVGQLSE